MEQKYEKALTKFTRNTHYCHELFIMATNRAPYDPIYVECSPRGHYNVTFGEIYSDEYLSENIFVIVPRYTRMQLLYIREHWNCPPEEIPDFGEMLAHMHELLEERIGEKREQQRRNLLEGLLPSRERKVAQPEEDTRIYLRSSSGDTHRLLS